MEGQQKTEPRRRGGAAGGGKSSPNSMLAAVDALERTLSASALYALLDELRGASAGGLEDACKKTKLFPLLSRVLLEPPAPGRLCGAAAAVLHHIFAESDGMFRLFAMQHPQVAATLPAHWRRAAEAALGADAGGRAAEEAATLACVLHDCTGGAACAWPARDVWGAGCSERKAEIAAVLDAAAGRAGAAAADSVLVGACHVLQAALARDRDLCDAVASAAPVAGALLDEVVARSRAAAAGGRALGWVVRSPASAPLARALALAVNALNASGRGLFVPADDLAALLAGAAGAAGAGGDPRAASLAHNMVGLAAALANGSARVRAALLREARERLGGRGGLTEPFLAAAFDAHARLTECVRQIRDHPWDEALVAGRLQGIAAAATATPVAPTLAVQVSSHGVCVLGTVLTGLHNIDEGIMRCALAATYNLFLDGVAFQRLFVEAGGLWPLADALGDYNVPIKLLALETLCLLAAGALDAEADGAYAARFHRDAGRTRLLRRLAKLVATFPSDDVPAQVLEGACSLLGHLLAPRPDVDGAAAAWDPDTQWPVPRSGFGAPARIADAQAGARACGVVPALLQAMSRCAKGTREGRAPAAALAACSQACCLALSNALFRDAALQAQFRHGLGFDVCHGLLSWALDCGDAGGDGDAATADELIMAALGCLVNAVDCNAGNQDSFAGEEWRDLLLRLLQPGGRERPARNSARGMACLLLSHVAWNHEQAKEVYGTGEVIRLLLHHVAAAHELAGAAVAREALHARRPSSSASSAHSTDGMSADEAIRAICEQEENPFDAMRMGGSFQAQPRAAPDSPLSASGSAGGGGGGGHGGSRAGRSRSAGSSPGPASPCAAALAGFPAWRGEAADEAAAAAAEAEANATGSDAEEAAVEGSSWAELAERRQAELEEVSFYALLAMINLSFRNARVQDEAGACGGLEAVVLPLSSPFYDTRKTAAFCLGNLVRDHPGNAERAAAAGAVDALVSLVNDDDNDELSKKAFQTLTLVGPAAAARVAALLEESSDAEPLARLLPVLNGLVYTSPGARERVLDERSVRPVLRVLDWAARGHAGAADLELVEYAVYVLVNLTMSRAPGMQDRARESGAVRALAAVAPVLEAATRRARAEGGASEAAAAPEWKALLYSALANLTLNNRQSCEEFLREADLFAAVCADCAAPGGKRLAAGEVAAEAAELLVQVIEGASPKHPAAHAARPLLELVASSRDADPSASARAQQLLTGAGGAEMLEWRARRGE